MRNELRRWEAIWIWRNTPYTSRPCKCSCDFEIVCLFLEVTVVLAKMVEDSARKFVILAGGCVHIFTRYALVLFLIYLLVSRITSI